MVLLSTAYSAKDRHTAHVLDGPYVPWDVLCIDFPQISNPTEHLKHSLHTLEMEGFDRFVFTEEHVSTVRTYVAVCWYYVRT